MDSLTQATLGAAVGHLCWSKKIGNRALLLGAVVGTIPDLDIILYPVLDDVQRLYWHRGESHSIFFVLLGSIVTAWLLSRYHRNGKLSFPFVFYGAVLIYATHILIDYFTVYGTQILAPVSRHGFALGNFFIIDPLFTLPLLVGCVCAFVSKTSFGIKANVVGLMLASCYTFWSITAQNIAEQKFQQALENSSETVMRDRTTAGPFTTFLWRHVAQTDSGFLIGYWSIFDDPDSPVEFDYIPRHEALTKSFAGTDAFTVLQWFSQDWWYAEETEDGTIKLVDLRFGAIRSAGSQTYRDWSWPFSWSFDPQVTRTRELSSIVPQIDAPLQTLGALAKRIAGDKDW